MLRSNCNSSIKILDIIIKLINYRGKLNSFRPSAKNEKNLLQVHHKDGVKWNDSRENLVVLCLVCHSNEPGHNKMKKTKQYSRALRLKYSK